MLLGYTIHEKDGDMGHVHDFLFDDTSWTIRYLVVETGGWLHRKRVLISTAALGHPEWSRRRFPVNLTREQVRNSPELDTDQPVYRQQEIAMSAYYGWPHYWTLEPILVAPAIVRQEEEPGVQGDPHLRSVKEVTGYRVPGEGEDTDLGHIADFIAEEQTWTIRYLVMEAGAWLRGKKILLICDSLQSISWARKEVATAMARQDAERAPAFDPAAPVNREHEVRVYDYYGRPKDEG